MKFLCGLLGAIVGVVSGFLAAMCATTLAYGSNSVTVGVMLLCLWPVLVIAGAFGGAAAALHLHYRVTDSSAQVPVRVKRVLLLRCLMSLLFVDASFAYIAAHANDAPADEVLLQNWQGHEHDFEQVVRMLDADKAVTAVDATTVREESSEANIPNNRKETYWRLLTATGTRHGIAAAERHREIRFGYWTAIGDTIDDEQRKGYVYCTGTPSPLLPTLNGFHANTDTYRPYVSTRVYRRIKGHWYLFYQYDPD